MVIIQINEVKDSSKRKKKKKGTREKKETK
jgi:hypothetical protein